MLMVCNSIDQNGGWATYNMQSENCTNLVEVENKDVLVYVTYPCLSENEILIPRIRILSNEMYLPLDGENPQILTIDITIDEENDVQFLASAVNPELDPNFENSQAIVFVAQGDSLSISKNFNFFTAISAVETEEYSALPFGHYSQINDKVYALDRAKQIIDAVKNSEPNACKSFCE